MTTGEVTQAAYVALKDPNPQQIGTTTTWGSCPSCGRCPTCGRGGYWYQYPTYPAYPWYSGVTYCGTANANT